MMSFATTSIEVGYAYMAVIFLPLPFLVILAILVAFFRRRF